MNPGNNSRIEDESNINEQSERKGLNNRKKSDSKVKSMANENSIPGVQLFQVVTKLAEEFQKILLENQELRIEIVTIWIFTKR